MTSHSLDTDTIVDLTRAIEAKPGDLVAAIWDVMLDELATSDLDARPGSPRLQLLRMLASASYSDTGDYLALCLDDVRLKAFSLDWHLANPDAHTECCEGPRCERDDCTDPDGRGPRCEDFPHDLLADAIGGLLDLLRARLGSARVDVLLDRQRAA